MSKSVEQFTIRDKDTKKLVRCECGCNVYHKKETLGELRLNYHVPEGAKVEELYICNSCGTVYWCT